MKETRALILRQALEKAKEAAGAHASPRVVELRHESGAAETEWTPPAFTVSRRVALDEAHLVANRCVCFGDDAAELEPYKVLRTKLQQLARERGWNAFMIAGPRESVEPARAAVNLALTYAKAFNQTVLLVDCDLRRQPVHRLLGYPGERGLVDHLIDRRPLAELIVWPSIGQMTVISGGRSVPHGAELLGSPRMRALVAELKGRYADRTLLFHAAPVLEGAEAIALAALVDAIVLVVIEGRTGMRETRRAVSLLPTEKLIGCTLVQPGATALHRRGRPKDEAPS